MSSRETKFPKKNVPARSIHQGTTIIGKNGLPVDALATIEAGTTLVSSNGTTTSYSAPTVTFDPSVDLTPLLNFDFKSAKHTGKLIFTDSSTASYFIDPDSVDNINKTVNIYLDPDFVNSPTSIGIASNWSTAEAELVNRLQTTTTAVVDNIEFRDVQVNVDLDGSTVNIKDDEGDQLEIDNLGNAQVKVHGNDFQGTDRIIKTSKEGEIVTSLDISENTLEERNFGITSGLVTTVGTDQTDFILLRNPSGSGVKIRVYKSRRGMATPQAGSIVRTYISPTVTTVGTPLTILPTYIKSPLPVSSVEAYFLPTISNRGTQALITVVPRSNITVTEKFDEQITIDPGFDILFTIENDNNNTESHLDIFWSEV